MSGTEATPSTHKALAAEITAEFEAIKADFGTRFDALAVKIAALPDALKTDIEDGIARLRSAL